MVQANANIDYIHTSFQYPVLTKVHDTPTYEVLKRIKDEIKANATNVQCDLGGGKHGHLGLVLTPAEYATINKELSQATFIDSPMAFMARKHVQAASAFAPRAMSRTERE